MTSEILGRGWGFPVTVANGAIVSSRYEKNIRESIWLILSTAKGERVMRPDFGCGIYELIFAPNSAGTAGRIKIEVREALLKWESRINVDKVQVNPGENGELVLISIDYTVRTSNSRFNMVYPFYLERSAG